MQLSTPNPCYSPSWYVFREFSCVGVNVMEGITDMQFAVANDDFDDHVGIV